LIDEKIGDKLFKAFPTALTQSYKTSSTLRPAKTKNQTITNQNIEIKNRQAPKY
jgi:hypothetical protein